MLSLRHLSILLCTTLLGLPGWSQTKPAKIDALLKQYVDYGLFNGSVLIAEKGKVILKKGYGLANMEWNIPNAPDTRFRLGSITKQFTGMLIMQLAEKGKLNVNDPITKYLPDYPKTTGDRITIHQLLTHTSGIPNYTNVPRFFETQAKNHYSPAEFIKTFQDLPLDFEPGSRFSYSNSGYFLLGTIIEKVTGQSYAQALQAFIVRPLNLQATGYDSFSDIIPKRATGYEKKLGSYVNAPYLDMSIPYAAGSLYSTVEDLYIWDQALYSSQLLSDASRKTLFTPSPGSYEPGFGYAYGWIVGKLKAGKDSISVIEHSGGINGFNTIITRVVNDKHLIVLLNNTGQAPLDNIRQNIVQILYDQPVQTPKRPVADLLRKAALTEKEAVVRQKFAHWKSDGNHEVKEDAINAMGYELLQHGDLTASLLVFDLNVESFPDSWNTYDSRGEALLTKGDTAASVRDYKKSLELNPGNHAGLEQLRKLGIATAAPVSVDEDTLRTYVGTYQLAPTFSIIITRDGSQLYAQATNQGRLTLVALSKDKFRVKEVDAQVSFVANAEGKIDHLILHQNGNHIKGARVD